MGKKDPEAGIKILIITGLISSIILTWVLKEPQFFHQFGVTCFLLGLLVMIINGKIEI